MTATHMTNISRRSSRPASNLLHLSLLGAACFAGNVLAQQPQGQLEEVIVTAQKRAESLQEVPISVTAFTAATLADMRIRDVTDISNATPNFSLLPQASSNTTYTVSMRGVGTSDTTLSSDSPIGIYVDGVVIPKNTGALFDAFDLERVEVLRGPQGTLYGRNTPAGAVNLISAKPTGVFGVNISAGFGRYNEREARLTLNTSKWELGDLGTLSARLTGSFLKRDGWVKELNSGHYLDNRNRHNGRLALRWEVGDFTVDYSFTLTDLNETPTAVQMTKDLTGFFTPYVQPRRSTSIALSIGNCQPNPPAPFGTCHDMTRLKTTVHAVQAAWNLSPDLTIKSITAYTGMDNAETTDYDGTPIAYLDSYGPNRFDTFSQELQASGVVDDGGITYVGGLYFSKDHGYSINPGVYGFGTVKQYSEYSLKDDAKAVYGQVDWRPAAFDRKLTLTAGVRYTKEKRELINSSSVVNDAFVVAHVDHVSKDYSKMTPAFTVGYDFLDNLHGYVRYANGWRSGGFNGRASTTEAMSTPFKPEKLKSYEVGLKGSFFEKRLDVSTAFFFSKYEDLQIVQVEPTGGGGYASVNANVGKIDISGMELELNALLTERLKAYATFGYVDTNIKEFFACVPVGATNCTLQNIGNDRSLYFNPRSTATLGFDYRIADTSYGMWRVRADGNWRASQTGGAFPLKYRPASSDPGYIPSGGLLNAKLALEEIPVPQGKAEVYIWARNLLNNDKRLAATDLTSQLGYAVARFNEPRTYGINFSYKY
jgi:iron complex outermembrane receptor protein